MKKEELPQDDANLLEGKFEKLYYVTESQGVYTGATSKGWEPENTALQMAWEDINQRVNEVRALVANGEASPVLYFMEKNLMNTQILSGYIGWPSFLLFLHFKPWFFKLLPESTKRQYAETFRVSYNEFISFKG